MNRQIQYCFLILLLSCFSLDSVFAEISQETDSVSAVSIEVGEQNGRKKVGLVLSGGGAKGVAHIGVIQALEENGIPIDYIAGTSAGAIVGGLYAAGYSPKEMYDFFVSQELDDCLKGKIDDKYLYYFTKANPDPSWLRARFSFSKEGLKFLAPASIISPKLIDFLFMEFFAEATAVAGRNFDSLFVPFRCVATDLTNQKAHYFKDGDVGKAVRASMTFPFYFNPIVEDSIIYFDGGIHDNFPVGEMVRSFAPDIIIGSKVAENFPTPKEGDLLGYIQKMISYETDYSLLDSSHSIMIEPDIPLVSVLSIIDFSNTPEITKLGYDAAVNQMEDIKNLIGNTTSKEEVEVRRKAFNDRKPPLYIDSVIVKNASKDQAKYIEDLLQKKDDPTYSLSDMKEYYLRFFSDDDIKYVHPELRYNQETKRYNLDIDVTMKRSFTVRLGGNLSLGAPSQAYIGLDYWQIVKNMRTGVQLNTYMGRFYSSVGLSLRADFSSKIPLYLKFDAVYNNWDYFRSEMFYFDKYGASYMTQREQYLSFEVGGPMGRNSKLALQAIVSSEKDEYYHKVPTNDDKSDETKFRPMALNLFFERNKLDHIQYPSSGTFFSADASFIYGKEIYSPGNTTKLQSKKNTYHRYVQASVKYNRYLDFSSIYKLGFLFDGYYSTQKFFTDYTSTMLHSGVFTPTIEGQQRFFSEFRSTEYLAAGLQNVFKLTSNLQIRLEGYIYQPIRDIRQNSSDYTSYYSDYFEYRYLILSSGIVYHSPIGPVSLIFNYRKLDDESYNKPFSVIFNVGYVLFNKRGVKR
ncbi:patatin-like phospholipase family protein [Bacteroidales bacterium OttesenSCG-928-C19]|nr:patatin-like phospholipase family protein [Bacteroidales bacterium OttesenSCG-928-C19]